MQPFYVQFLLFLYEFKLIVNVYINEIGDFNVALWKPVTANGEEAGNLTFVTDGNHNPQANYCFQTPSMNIPWVKVDLTLLLNVVRVVLINTYDELLCKLKKSCYLLQ